MKTLLPIILLILASCGSIGAVDRSLSDRIAQMETSVSKVKAEAIQESKEAAKEIVKETVPQLQKATEEVGIKLVDKMSEEMESVSISIIDKSDAILEKRIKQLEESTAKILKEDVPASITKATTDSADKIAERLGFEKKSVIGTDGIPMEVWVGGASGLAAFLGFLVNFIRNYMNAKKGARRYTKEEFEEHVEHVLRKNKLINDKPS